MQISKSWKMTGVRYDIRGPVSEEADRLEKQGVSIIRLNTGNPAAFGFDAAPAILESLSGHAQMAAAYSGSKGIFEAREAIAEYCSGLGYPNVTPDDVYTGNGVSELIQISLNALLNDGDEILVPTPDYPLWTAAARLAGGKVIHYVCDEQSEWYPDLDDLKKKVTPRTKALVIISPNNPTGAVYPREVLAAMVQIARENDLLIFSDEIYDRLLMDGYEHVPVATLAPDLPVITFNGLSKSHQLCGYRCGWLTISGDKDGARDYIEGLTTLASMRLCSNVTAQSVIKTALSDRSAIDAYTAPGGRLYEQRECAYNLIREIPGFSVVKPRAALYMFPKMDVKRFNIVDDERFVLDFLRKEHVLLTHGGSYNWALPDHFRLVYLPHVEELTYVLGRLKAFMEHYSQV